MKQFFIFILIAISYITSAQEVTIKAYANSESISLGEYIQYTIESNTRGEFEIPDFENFKVIRGGGTGSSSSISIVNGKMTRTETYSSSYIIQATKKGKLTIKPSSISVNGKTYKSESIIIYVDESKPKTEAPKDTEHFARIKLNKTKCFTGQPIVATYYMYSKFRPQDAAVNLKSANQNFWSSELKKEYELRTEQINGVNYYALECKTMILFPQKSGELKIEPFDGQMQVLKERSSGFFSVPRFETINLKSNAPSITVLPLPGNESNYVGEYKIFMEVSKTQTKTNEGFDLKITLEGTGNLKRINDIELNLPEDFEVFDPEINENIKLTNQGYSGKKTFNYLVVPRSEGVFEINPIQFKYFSPAKNKFTTSETPSFTIEVLKGDLTQNSLQTNQNNKKNVEVIDNNIRYIKSETELFNQNDIFYKKWWFWLSILLPVLLLLYILLIQPFINNREAKADPFKLAQKELEKAEKNIKNDDVFYKSLLSAWQLILCEKLNLELSQFNKHNIQEKLKNSPYSTQILGILNQLDMAKYAPIEIKGKEELLKNSKTLIKSFSHEF